MPRFFYEPRSICSRCRHEPRVKIALDKTTIYCPNCQQTVTGKTDQDASRAWLKVNPDKIEEKLFYRYVFLNRKNPVAIHACNTCGNFPEPREIRGFVMLICPQCSKHVMKPSVLGAFYEWNRVNPLPEQYEID